MLGTGLFRVCFLPVRQLLPSPPEKPGRVAGEQLSSGWEVVLRLLETVPKLEDAPCISLAFQSVQLVAADFMSNLPARLLRSALEVAALYAAQQVCPCPWLLRPLLQSPGRTAGKAVAWPAAMAQARPAHGRLLQADMNVSLTAINLLWNTADLLARRSVHSLGGAQAAAPSPVPNGNAPTELLDTHQFEELLRILFTAIQVQPAASLRHGALPAVCPPGQSSVNGVSAARHRSPGTASASAQSRAGFAPPGMHALTDFLCVWGTQGMSTDVRPEVRNCAVRTLFLVVVGQGARLSPPVWEEVLWQLVFPLLRSVHHMAATSSREEASSEQHSRLISPLSSMPATRECARTKACMPLQWTGSSRAHAAWVLSIVCR